MAELPKIDLPKGLRPKELFTRFTDRMSFWVLICGVLVGTFLSRMWSAFDERRFVLAFVMLTLAVLATWLASYLRDQIQQTTICLTNAVKRMTLTQRHRGETNKGEDW